MKVAIVTDWLTNMGGAERVVLELHKMFPEAPIYTSLFDEQKMPLFRDADIRPSWINRLPLAKKKHQLFPVVRGWYFNRLKLNGYDLIISASGAEAKAVKAPKGTIHINYCHSPTHYYWVRPEEYLANPGFGRFFSSIYRFGLKVLIKNRRVWDYLAAQEADLLVANSTVTKERIRQFYDRDSTIVFPPVDLKRFKNLSVQERSGFITVGRQVHYMRRDLAVIACSRLNLPLTVIGSGPEHQKLRQLAGPTIRFIADATDEVVADELAKAEGFIFPGVEDFGIVAIEAMAAGTPVIAIKAGGALDSVEEGVSGEFFERQNVRSLMKVLKNFDGSKYSQAVIQAHAKQFSVGVFRSNIKRVISEVLPS